MRWLGSWAVVLFAGAAIVSASGCLTSQDNPGNRGGGDGPPAITGRSGSGGSNGRGAEGGEDTGGSTNKGGRAGTSSTGNGEGGSDSGCSTDSDCAFRIDGRSICYAATGECVDCRTASDCESGGECVDNECRQITTCASSDDCPTGLVCNPTTDRCVECVAQNDCATGYLCAANKCRQRCTADSHCAPLGLRCNSSQYCASCVSDSDCAETRNCQQGECVRDICRGGTASCEAGGLSTCNAAGSVLSPPTPCRSQESCKEDSSGASCEPWVCLPSTTGCSMTGERVVRCSADGLTETLVDDCEAADQLCIGGTGGMCTDATCEPDTRYCVGNTVLQCDSTGTMPTLYQTCSANLLCNPATTTCTVPLCTPGEPACDGNVYTTCDDEGFGYTGMRTDCTDTDEFCGSTGCTSSAVDVIPAMPALYTGGALPNYEMLNFYTVTGNRTLSRIEQYMNPTTATTLNWYVYEALMQQGPYSNILTSMTTSTTGVGYQSSGTVNVPLVAGRYYAIGLSWTMPATGFGYMQPATPSQALSFGSLTSAYIFNGTTPPNNFSYTSPSGFFFPQRLTTTP